MFFKPVIYAALAVLLASLPFCYSHGLMSYPPSRNWICGYWTKPDHTTSPSGGVHPECAPAFVKDFQGGYQFMSVLTHDLGRAGVSQLPTHVCGFDSETWNYGATPWDTPMDWPTNSMVSGMNDIVWDIGWGNHFSDTEDFRYYITNSDFVFDPTKDLTWDDFESEPFCELFYDDSNPTGNPNVIPDYPNDLFTTKCNVPARSGRHVIYGEWGRNEYTYERFHGCIDAVFDGSVNPVPGPPSSPTPPTPPTPPSQPSPTPPSPSPPTPTPPSPSPPASQDGCCTWTGLACQHPENVWCNEKQSQCEGSCNGTWLSSTPSPPAPTPTPPTPTPPTTPQAPAPVPAPPTTPQAPAPVPAPAPAPAPSLGIPGLDELIQWLLDLLRSLGLFGGERRLLRG